MIVGRGRGGVNQEGRAPAEMLLSTPAYASGKATGCAMIAPSCPRSGFYMLYDRLSIHTLLATAA